MQAITYEQLLEEQMELDAKKTQGSERKSPASEVEEPNTTRERCGSVIEDILEGDERIESASGMENTGVQDAKRQRRGT